MNRADSAWAKESRRSPSVGTLVGIHIGVALGFAVFVLGVPLQT